MPILITEKQYEHAMAIIHGKRKMMPFFEELKTWIEQQFNIKVIDFFIENSYNSDKKRIHMLLYIDMNYQQDSYRRKLEQINKKMVELCEKYEFMNVDQLHSSIGFYNFIPIYKAHCVEIASKKAIPFLENKYALSNISKIIYSGYGSVTVFFTLKKDAEQNKILGINNEMKKDFYKILKPLDEFNLINEDEGYITFDSKEFLDIQFNGNLYHYYK